MRVIPYTQSMAGTTGHRPKEHTMITLAKFAAPATIGVHAAALADRFPNLAGIGEAADLAAAYTVRKFDAEWSPAPVSRHGVILVGAMRRNNLAALAEYLEDMRA